MIRVQSAPAVPLHNFWNNFHFHPTDAIEDDWGRRILDTAAADRVGKTILIIFRNQKKCLIIEV